MVTIKRLRHGTFAYHASDMIGRILDRYGEWSNGELSFLLDLLNEGDAVVDVGAHIGTFTVPFARKVGPQGGVLAFEAQRLVFQNLATNVFLNQLNNVRAENIICAREPYFLKLREFAADQNANSGGFHFSPDARSPRTWHATRAEPLDTLLLGLSRLALLKIDVESFEAEVLSGAGQTLERLRPVVHCECQSADSFRFIKGIAEQYDYRLFGASFAQFSTDNHFGADVPEAYRTARDINVLLWPSARPLPSDRELHEVSTFQQLLDAPSPTLRTAATAG